MTKKRLKNQVVVYQAKNGAIELKADFRSETIWATQSQVSEVFGVNPQAITKHLQNIYREGELIKKATCSKMEQVQIEGEREVKRSVKVYNLDAIISVGYRINSRMGTKFRQWATRILRSHIVDGYTINKKRIAQNYEQFLEAVEQVKKLLPASNMVDANSALELIKFFADTWLSLSAYDKSDLPKKGATRRQVEFTSDELAQAVQELRTELIRKREASELFATNRQKNSIAGIVGNVFQSFSGSDLYPSIEEKAAHLLYFVIKNHPFIDGNKRSGAFAFIWFLQKARILDTSRLTPEALTALTLLIAESNSKDKERMVGLVLMLIKGHWSN